jgi:hypothetical protein
MRTSLKVCSLAGVRGKNETMGRQRTSITTNQEHLAAVHTALPAHQDLKNWLLKPTAYSQYNDYTWSDSPYAAISIMVLQRIENDIEH